MKKILLGNVITADDSNPTAQAVVVEDGIIKFVGSKQDAINYAGDCEVVDFKNNYIYPGFMESHCHGLFAGYRAMGQANVSSILGPYEEYIPVIKKFIEDNPNKEIYMVSGWNETGRELDYTFLDNIYNEKPLVMNTTGGHSMLLNTKAMEYFHIDKDAVEKHGKTLIHTNDSGEPTGYVCEEVAVRILNEMPISPEDAKNYILKWQEIALSKGYTAVCDAGSELIYKDANIAYNQLDKENKLKLRTYAHSIVADNVEDPTAAIDRIIELQNKYEGKYYKIIGPKVFLDGVAEAKTAWTCEEYTSKPGFYGLKRFHDENKMVELITQASKHNMSVHAHSEGDGATSFMINCIKKSQTVTNDYNQRNIIAHLHYVKKENFDDMVKTNTIPLTAPLWIAKFPGAYQTEEKDFGVERTINGYPIKSFFDVGCKVCYHTDYPISPIMDVARSFFMAEKRTIPEEDKFGAGDMSRNPIEGVSRLDSLKALTINVAYELKQEKLLGSIEVGKIANMAIMDTDLLNCDIFDLPKAKLLHTIVDGEVVYSNN